MEKRGQIILIVIVLLIIISFQNNFTGKVVVGGECFIDTTGCSADISAGTAGIKYGIIDYIDDYDPIKVCVVDGRSIKFEGSRNRCTIVGESVKKVVNNLIGDFNEDGCVDELDNKKFDEYLKWYNDGELGNFECIPSTGELARFGGCWSPSKESLREKYDLNKDNQIGLGDLVILGKNFDNCNTQGLTNKLLKQCVADCDKSKCENQKDLELYSVYCDTSLCSPEKDYYLDCAKKLVIKKFAIEEITPNEDVPIFFSVFSGDFVPYSSCDGNYISMEEKIKLTEEECREFCQATPRATCCRYKRDFRQCYGMGGSLKSHRSKDVTAILGTQR